MPVRPNDLQEFATDLLISGGFRAEHATDTARILVWADKRGTHSHGVLRIPRYVEMVRTGIINPDATLAETPAEGAVAMIDANRMPGATAMAASMDRAVKLANASGIGLCSVRNITHAGAIGYFGLRAAAEGCIGIVMSASGPLMAYHGARVSSVSTNPLAIVVPDDPYPVLLDMSTSTVALGKVMQARTSGNPIPEGWGLDKDGKPTTDADRVVTLTPVGGPKGAGLSLMIEILASVLAGNPIISTVLSGGQPHMNGLALAVNISAFTDISTFAAQIRQLVRAIKGLPPTSSTDEILLPGERGFRQAQASLKDGIKLANGTTDRLRELADQFGITPPASL